MTVGERIQAARKKAGMKQSDLAGKLGVAVITIGQYERGKREPRLGQLKAISAALDVDVNWLMNGYTLEQRDQASKDYVARRFAEAEVWKARKDEIGEDLAKLNDDGQIEAVKRVKELTRLDEYRRRAEPSPLSAGIKVYGDGPAGSFPPAPEPAEAPPASPGDTDTPAAQDAPEGAEEGE